MVIQQLQQIPVFFVLFLLQLFDTDNIVNKHALEYIFTTEGHIVKVDAALRDKPWRRDMPACVDDTSRAVARANESFVTHSVSLPLLNPVNTILLV